MIKEKIKDIIKEEFLLLLDNIEKDFKINFGKKQNNFLLTKMDDEMTAHMVFVSSFESKSGNAIQACARKIAILKFGSDNVPLLINPNNLIVPDNITEGKEQQIITDVNFESALIQGKIQEFMTSRMGQGKGKSRIESTVDQNSIKELLSLTNLKNNCITSKPVDLAFFDGICWNLIEIKAGGDLDNTNAPGNVKKMLTLYTAFNNENAKLYFATIYNKNGEGNNWVGAVKKYLSYPDMFLIGSEFWTKILPSGITFDEFCTLYQETMQEIDINQRLKAMIKTCCN